jgi:serine/threonine-protein kinase HipA
MRAARIYVNKIPAGVLTETRDGSFTFRYEDSYFSDLSNSSVSLALPKTQQEYRSETLSPFFYNMLSEGVSRRIQSRLFKIDEADDFGILLATA